ncbi:MULTISPECIES: hypothetical protein [unclassified Lentimonas]|uniref:hypothetical protein n=1 Tax=unclassified Lentimonas TaxID=2630993 RepID=UPI00132C0A0D|nr:MULTISPECIES: hypothetical protein [unclassified Lentimonas]CAA6677331.1 Unannotated [Lentimonas sp. CC4]CAA6686876.1 Unannotated [Lentimonas sp. CC6]CAA6691159.1 Unannotated [Lentimonas sp. CC19]CAA6694717.1 Unannotated [Lentimonas sp. CC10]CAA7071541.1 Unannotated [Lentimonas sp. CC11]
MSKRVKGFLLLFSWAVLSNQPCLVASESAVSLFPKVKSQSTHGGDDGRLNPKLFTRNTNGKARAWRSKIKAQEGDSIDIELKTGDWGRAGPSDIAMVWASYNQDWAPISASGKTITYSYTFGESTIGVSSSFRLIANQESRKDGFLGDCALILNYGERDCTFYLNGQTSTGKLTDPIVSGTSVTITLHPNKTLDIQINDTPVIADQKLIYDENYIVFSASSEARSNPDAPRQLTLREVTAKVH